MTCYVCHKEIDPRKVNPGNYDAKSVKTFVAFVSGEYVKRSDLPVYVGKDMYRHESCAPGSSRWMRVQEAKPKKHRSEIYRYFLLDKSEE
jgi:hypothetical protein